MFLFRITSPGKKAKRWSLTMRGNIVSGFILWLCLFLFFWFIISGILVAFTISESPVELSFGKLKVLVQEYCSLNKIENWKLKMWTKLFYDSRGVPFLSFNHLRLHTSCVIRCLMSLRTLFGWDPPYILAFLGLVYEERVGFISFVIARYVQFRKFDSEKFLVWKVC